MSLKPTHKSDIDVKTVGTSFKYNLSSGVRVIVFLVKTVFCQCH